MAGFLRSLRVLDYSWFLFPACLSLVVRCQAAHHISYDESIQNPEGRMKEIALIIFGAVVGFFVSRIQSSLDKRRDAKDAFLVFISIQRRSIDRRDFDGWHLRTKTDFRDAISRVHRFLRRPQRNSIDDTWREYDAIRDDQLRNENETGILQELEAIDTSKPPRTPKPSEILNSFLDRFEQAAR